MKKEIKEIKVELINNYEQTYWEKLEVIRKKINELVKFCNELKNAKL